jgi:hypothetical protein
MSQICNTGFRGNRSVPAPVPIPDPDLLSTGFSTATKFVQKLAFTVLEAALFTFPESWPLIFDFLTFVFNFMFDLSPNLVPEPELEPELEPEQEPEQDVLPFAKAKSCTTLCEC